MNVKSILFLRESTEDLRDGQTFYNSIQPGVGSYFHDSLLADIESLLIYAGVHVRSLGLYRMLARRFPYAIYYEIEKGTVYIIAILPMRDNPVRIKRKVKNRL